MAMLEIRGVRKSFHTYAKPGVRPGIFGRAPKPVSSLDVLRGVDLTVEKGDVVAILGPSGSGKTTLLRCLNFLETADAGTLTFDGEAFDLARADRASIARLRRKTAFVFQNYNLFRNKTALQNVTEGLIVARKMPKNEANAIGMKMLEKVGLADRADYYPRQLSGGQQQRVAIARALVTNPAIICMDEPLSNLDAKLRNQMRAELIKLRHEIKGTFIYVTHDQTEAMTLGDRIVVMKDGVVQQIATPQEVFNHPANIFVAGFIGVPQMNFFDAQLVRSGNGFTVKTEDMNVALAPETCAQLALNWDGGDVKEITAGVRPEQILLADKGEEGALQGTVEVTELMGSTEHVHVTAPDGQFVLIIPVVDLEAKGALKAGDTIWFKFEKNATHLFDKVSGKNLI